MASTLVELTASIVASHAVGSELSGDQLIQEINMVFAVLKKLDEGGSAAEETVAPSGPTLTLRKAFQKDQVGCMICGKMGFKTLTRHLKQAHDLKPGQYRKQFNIPSSQSLTASAYSEARRQSANNNNLADNLVKARAVRAAKNNPVVQEKPSPVVKSPKTPKAPKSPAKESVKTPSKPEKPTKAAPSAKVAKPAKVDKSKPAVDIVVPAKKASKPVAKKTSK